MKVALDIHKSDALRLIISRESDMYDTRILILPTRLALEIETKINEALEKELG